MEFLQGTDELLLVLAVGVFAFAAVVAFLHRALSHVDDWKASYGTFDAHPSQQAVDADRLADVFDRYLSRLEGNYPFHHPRYAGQMLKPPHPVAVAAYTAAMQINPNNHALDGGPPTSEMEKEVVQKLIGLVDFPEDALGHLTSGGTVANLEALWVAREIHPNRAIAFSEDAHYTHGRMCGVLNADTVTGPSITTVVFVRRSPAAPPSPHGRR